MSKDTVFFSQGLKGQEIDYFIQNINDVSSKIMDIIGHFGKVVNRSGTWFHMCSHKRFRAL